MKAEERERLVDAMARARHEEWRKEWRKLGHNDSDLVPWESLPPGAQLAAIRCERAALSALEASGVVWLAPWEITDDLVDVLISAGPVHVRENDRPAFVSAIIRDYRALREAATAGAEPAGEE